MPTINFVIGNNTISNIINGKDLVIFTTFDNITFIVFDGIICPLDVTTRTVPITSPIITEKNIDTLIIYSVSTSGLYKRFIHSLIILPPLLH